MDNKNWKDKVVETAFWIVISPFVSVTMVTISICLGVATGGKWFIEQAIDYTKTIERIWTN